MIVRRGVQIDLFQTPIKLSLQVRNFIRLAHYKVQECSISPMTKRKTSDNMREESTLSRIEHRYFLCLVYLHELFIYKASTHSLSDSSA